MRFKNLLTAFAFVVLLYPLIHKTYSATLQLTKIGALDLGGKMYSEWWYTGINPTFYGKAAANSEVSLKIVDNTFKTNSNGSGDWSYYAALENGDYSVVISQGSENISFKLHLGQNLPANIGSGTSQATSSGTTVPDTGYNQIVALSFGLGIILLSSYLYVWGGGNKSAIFEKRIIKED